MWSSVAVFMCFFFVHPFLMKVDNLREKISPITRIYEYMRPEVTGVSISNNNWILVKLTEYLKRLYYSPFEFFVSKMYLWYILIFCFQFTGSNGVLDTFLVFLILFNYVIPISLYVTVGRYPERYGTVSLCKKACLLISLPIIETFRVTSSRDWCEALVILWNSTLGSFFVIKIQVEKIWRKTRHF